jgi:hypothetical protein
MVTSVLTMPCATFLTLPLSALRALMCMSTPSCYGFKAASLKLHEPLERIPTAPPEYAFNELFHTGIDF